MQQAFARQMVAEWRDRQIVAGGRGVGDVTP